MINLDNIGKLFLLDENFDIIELKLKSEIDRCRQQIRKNKIKNNDLVVIKTTNQHEILINYLALNFENVKVCILNYKIDDATFGHIIELLKPIAIFEESEIKIISYTEPPSLLKADLYLFSSGTTGTQKLIGLSNKKINNQILSISKLFDGSTNILNFLPLSFGHGLIANTLAPLLSQKKLVLTKKEFSIDVALNFEKIIVENEIQAFSTVPTHLAVLSSALQNKIITNKISIHNASSPLTEKHYNDIKKIFLNSEIRVHYGLTEMGSWITDYRIKNFKFGAVGTLIGNSNLKIDTNNHILVQILDGDLEIISIGQKTSKLHKEGSFYDTLDLGVIDTESKITLIGRESDFINKAGYKISPFEIENKLIACPDVVESVCFSIESQLYGEEVAVLVVPQFNDTMVEARIYEYCKKNIESFKRPKMIIIVDKIPKTPNGKISRQLIKNSYLKK